MNTEPIDIQKLSHFVAKKYNKFEYLIEYEDRVSIASVSILKTLSYRKQGQDISGGLVIQAALSDLKKAIDKRMKEYITINSEMYKHSKIKNKCVNPILNREEVKSYINTLKEPDKTVVLLRIFKHKTWLEIGKLLNKSSTGVLKIYFQAIKRLGTRLRSNLKREAHLDERVEPGELL